MFSQSKTLTEEAAYDRILLTFSAVCFCLLLSLLHFELHVAKVHDCTDYLVTAILLLRSESKRVHRMLEGKVSKLTYLWVFNVEYLESKNLFIGFFIIQAALTSVASSSSPSSMLSTVITPCEQKW